MPTPRSPSAAIADSDVVDLGAYQDALLVERALAGDVEAQTEWLWKFGGPEWRAAIDAEREHERKAGEGPS